MNSISVTTQAAGASPANPVASEASAMVAAMMPRRPRRSASEPMSSDPQTCPAETAADTTPSSGGESCHSLRIPGRA